MKNIAIFKEKLLGEKKTLIDELSKIGVVKNSEYPDDWQATSSEPEVLRSDPNEVADKIESFEQNNDLVHTLETRLLEVENALTRIKDGTYGICEIGGEEIEEERLEANPASTTCIKHMKM